MAKYSPRWRPSTIAEKPATGCPARGKVMPLTVPGGRNVPETGGPSIVFAGRTARPTSTGPRCAGLAGVEDVRALIVIGVAVRARVVQMTTECLFKAARVRPDFITAPENGGPFQVRPNSSRRH